jgi:hypothetical protein
VQALPQTGTARERFAALPELFGRSNYLTVEIED